MTTNDDLRRALGALTVRERDALLARVNRADQRGTRRAAPHHRRQEGAVWSAAGWCLAAGKVGWQLGREQTTGSRRAGA